jgi:hypothetical protein
MFLCFYVSIKVMRTTIDLPDALFRKTKATAAMRGSSMKDLIVRAVEREVGQATPRAKAKQTTLPVIRRWTGRKLDLTHFDFDDLLG